MDRRLGAVTFLVRDYDEAIRFFTVALGFELIEDTALADGKRWGLVAPPEPVSTALLLAKAVGPTQVARIGDQAGGGVFLFLHTDDFRRDYAAMPARGVVFREPPRQEAVAVFEDLYGNRWDLLQPR